MVISSQGRGPSLVPRLLPVVQCFSVCNIEKIEMSLGTRLGIAYWDQRIRVHDYLCVCMGGYPNCPWSIDLAYDSILDPWIQMILTMRIVNC